MERIGLIDLGSNTARLTIYDVYEGGYFVTVDETKEQTKLGDTEKDGNLKQTRVLQAISTIKSFKKVCAVYNVDKIIPFTTAAVRNAKNQKSFLNDVFSATGLRFQVLSEEEETMHDYHGVINSIEVPKGVICEIGGGSIKLVQYNRRNVMNKTVLPFGAVTLAGLFVKDDVKPEVACLQIEEYVKEKLSMIDWLSTLEPDYQLVGVGGSIRSLARIVRKIRRYPLEMVHNYRIEKEDFDYVYNMIKPFDLEKASKIKGLSSARADVFPCAMAALKAFIDYCSFGIICCCGSGIREGIMYNYAHPITIEKPIVDVLGYSIQTKIRQWNIDGEHAEQVFGLCIQLFKQLRVLHKFPRAYVRVLRIASMLYEAGRQVKYYDYPRHTSYMLLRSNLQGVSHSDIVLAAYVCNVFSKEDFSYTDWSKFNSMLTPEDIEAVNKLSVMLQLAVAFDISRKRVIKEINCDVLGDSVILKTETDGDSSLEIREANRYTLDFKRVFKKNLEIL